MEMSRADMLALAVLAVLIVWIVLVLFTTDLGAS
jgi:hypothetical protein